MPEFILDHGSIDASKAFNDLDDFTQGYIEAAFFTNTGDPDDEDLEHASLAELAPESLAKIKADCADFQKSFGKLIEQAIEQGDYSETSAGADFWFTRNGHGVGFWDSGLGDVGDKLSDMSRPYGDMYMYRGDDGMIYVE